MCRFVKAELFFKLFNQIFGNPLCSLIFSCCGSRIHSGAAADGAGRVDVYAAVFGQGMFHRSSRSKLYDNEVYCQNT